MELTKSRLFIIIGGAITIILLGVFSLLYAPLIRDLREKNLECKMCETDLFDARNLIESVKTTEVKGTLIAEEEIPFTIEELTRQGRLTGINFISVTPKEIEKPKDSQYRILPIEVRIESSYKKLGLFLGSLGKLEKSLVTIRSFNAVTLKENPSMLKTKLVVNMHLTKNNAE